MANIFMCRVCPFVRIFLLLFHPHESIWLILEMEINDGFLELAHYFLFRNNHYMLTAELVKAEFYTRVICWNTKTLLVLTLFSSIIMSSSFLIINLNSQSWNSANFRNVLWSCLLFKLIKHFILIEHLQCALTPSQFHRAYKIRIVEFETNFTASIVNITTRNDEGVSNMKGVFGWKIVTLTLSNDHDSRAIYIKQLGTLS